MNKSQLIETLKTLSNKEIKRFESFVLSSYFNTNETTNFLLQHILTDAPNYDSERISLENCFRHLFPKQKKVNAQKVRDQMSILYKLLKKFLIFENWQQKEEEQDLALLEQLRKRRLYKLHAMQFKVINEKFQQSEILDSHHYWLQHRLTEEAEANFVFQEIRKNQSELLQKSVNSLDIFYISKKLLRSSEMLNRSSIVNTDFALHLMEPIEETLGEMNEEYLQVPVILINFQIYRMLKHPEDSSHFFNLLELLEKHSYVFSKSEAHTNYRMAQNYCIRRINNGEEQFLGELFRIYQRLLSSKILIENDEIRPPDYNNVISVGLRLKAYDWVKMFMENYTDLLPPMDRKNAYNYNLAKLYYEQQEFDKVIDLLNIVKFTDILYEINTKYYLMKLYYDQDELDVLSYSIIAFERLVKRNKQLSTQNRGGIINFLYFLKKLAKLKKQVDYKDKEYIAAQKQKVTQLLEEKKPVTNINWIKDKLKEL